MPAPPMPETSSTPKPKIAAAGIAGAITTVVVLVAGQLNLDIPPELAAAIATVIAFVAGYLKRDSA